MRNRHRRRRLLARRGAIIVEFALVVPFISLLVFGVIDFSRAYTQMNALNSALREGSRYGSKIKNVGNYDYTTMVKTKIQEYANLYGFSGLDLSKITVTLTNSSPGNIEFITVTATAHPIPLQILGRFLGVPNLSVTRAVMFRYECAGLSTAQCI
jgi:Flp pilus assembly protein TadG